MSEKVSTSELRIEFLRKWSLVKKYNIQKGKVDVKGK